MTDIPYHFSRNRHTIDGARRGFQYLASGRRLSSVLDVGAGVGTWLAAAREHGIKDIRGLDGLEANASQLYIEPGLIEVCDLRKPIMLGRRFDAVICLEVAEHLDEVAAETLIQTLCAHSDLIFFSAAAPGQLGEHHVNCRWPTYWQELFNAQGFACADDLRPQMWDDLGVEPWYRQNIFTARHDPQLAGREHRLRHLIHPEMTRHMEFPDSPPARRDRERLQGKYHPLHYARLLGRSLSRRIFATLAEAPR